LRRRRSVSRVSCGVALLAILVYLVAFAIWNVHWSGQGARGVLETESGQGRLWMRMLSGRTADGLRNPLSLTSGTVGEAREDNANSGVETARAKGNNPRKEESAARAETSTVVSSGTRTHGEVESAFTGSGTHEPTLSVTVNATVYKRLQGGFGRLCNQMVILATGLSLAERDGFVLLIRYNDFPVLGKLDLDLLKKTFGHLFRFKGGAYPEHDNLVESGVLVAATTYWCGLKTAMKSIRVGIRPRPHLIDAAQKEIENMRSKVPLDTDLVSVHIRNYDGLCENLLPDSCEWDSGYEFRPKPFGCNQTLTAEYLHSIKSEFPEHDWSRRRMSVYLSTDRQVESVDLSWRNGHRSLGIDYLFEPGTVKSSKVKNEYTPTSDLFVDMWISVLADFYVAMPRSSCEKIIAEWRSVVHSQNNTPDRMSPRQCFRNYYYPASTQRQPEICPHTTFLALDTKIFPPPSTSACAICEFLLALGAALSKAKRHQREALHLYGKWGEFTKQVLDVEQLKSFANMVYVGFRELDEWVLYNRMQIYGSSRLRGSAIWAGNQSRCARGKRIDALLSLSVVPNERIRREAVEQMTVKGWKPMYIDACESDSATSSYCFQGAKPCSKTFSRRDSETRDEGMLHSSSSLEYMLRNLWMSALADDGFGFNEASPCAQVVALWRIGLNKTLGSSGRDECCFDTTSVGEEPEEISAFKPATDSSVFWQCP